MISYVYLDRSDDEKLSLLVDGAANPEAGEVSASSPLGVALLETPVGSVATIDIKGVNRKVRVIEVAED
jgi:transcription elongation GreA/GreB family factor